MLLSEEKKKHLDARTTAYVLGMFRGLYHASWESDEWGNGSPAIALLDGMEYTREELKEYLDTRPHVLNKKESKAARIERKKSGKKRT